MLLHLNQVDQVQNKREGADHSAQLAGGRCSMILTRAGQSTAGFSWKEEQPIAPKFNLVWWFGQISIEPLTASEIRTAVLHPRFLHMPLWGCCIREAPSMTRMPFALFLECVGFLHSTLVLLEMTQLGEVTECPRWLG